ncbi:TAXI family TRAP transporter solute-binding subunit [Sandaracinus amylolyticus]|uniref:TAXI family TRAP transporter solute-binding subunit n=1 Tax=Sandaracinus amylolyticus TaxID=927083 RepID=UPI001F1CF8F7|nr:TAXI family TRAP transporter solute-binding subunit [Sandaracinus amylolyticus]UJR78671.1 TRAP transporter solute receptor, TAXI family [Sandaracinus amylolyticus]
MVSLRIFFARLRQVGDSPRALALLASIFLLASAVFLRASLDTEEHTIRLTAGDRRGRRTEVAEALRIEAAAHELELEIVPAAGSDDALERLSRRELDAALIQGGLPGTPELREVAAVALEPLHLLVRGDIAMESLDDLRGRRVNLAPPGSGTRGLALEVLALAHLEPSRDFDETQLDYRELESLPAERLPDAIFHVSALPSPLASFLVDERGYRLAPLPYADAIALRNVAVSRGRIPAYAYGADAPAHDVPTLATRMLLVVHRDTSDEVVKRLLESLASDSFGARARIARAEISTLVAQPEYPLHPGTLEWLHRNDPLLTPELMEGIESLRSFLVSLVVAGILAYRWWRRSRVSGLDRFFAEVSRIDREALALERETHLDLARMVVLRTRLGETKTRALEAFARGQVHSEELLSSFLVHVADVRSHLNAMILHERDRIEKRARAIGRDEEAALREMWEEALADVRADRETQRGDRS